MEPLQCKFSMKKRNLLISFGVLFFIAVFFLVGFIWIIVGNSGKKTYHGKPIIPYKEVQKLRNEDFPKKKILFFVSHDYTKLPDYAIIAVEVLRWYCQRHGYDFKNMQHPPEEMSPYWLRVWDFKDFLKNTNYDYIVYSDLDITILNHSMRIETIINGINQISAQKNSYKEYSMYIGWDFFMSTFNRFNMINSGFIILKNNEWAKQIVDVWLSMCFDMKTLENVGHCKRWNRTTVSVKNGVEKKRWKCNKCGYGKLSYEQGSLNHLYVSNVLNCGQHIYIAETTFFTSRANNKDSFLHHALGKSDKKRYKEFVQNKNKIIEKHYNFEEPVLKEDVFTKATFFTELKKNLKK